MERKNYILKISYDGRSYGGWRRQGHDSNTIQQIMEEALRRMTGTKVNLHAASWTDAGVHAEGQIAVMVARYNAEREKFLGEANAALPDDIRILDLVPAPLGFDPIGGNKGKHYRYTIWNSETTPPDISICWQISSELDREAMNQAAQLLVGRHDFIGIKLPKDRRKDCVRTIYSCEVSSCNDNIFIDIKGDNFIYMMIRTLTAALVEIGTGRKEPKYIEKLLTAKDNRFAPAPASPSGLCLIEIYFDKI